MVRGEQDFSEMGQAGIILGPAVQSPMQLLILVIMISEAIVGHVSVYVAIRELCLFMDLEV